MEPNRIVDEFMLTAAWVGPYTLKKRGKCVPERLVENAATLSAFRSRAPAPNRQVLEKVIEQKMKDKEAEWHLAEQIPKEAENMSSRIVAMLRHVDKGLARDPLPWWADNFAGGPCGGEDSEEEEEPAEEEEEKAAPVRKTPAAVEKEKPVEEEEQEKAAPVRKKPAAAEKEEPAEDPPYDVGWSGFMQAGMGAFFIRLGR